METPETKKGPATEQAKPSEENTTIYSAHFNGLVDLVSVKNQTQYLVKKNGDLILETKHLEKGIIHKPPQRDKLPIDISKAEDVLTAHKLWQADAYTENRKLFNDIVSYLREVSHLPKEALYYLLAAWIIHTYRQEDASHSPVICFFAVAERGKTRTGKALTFLAYRGVRLVSLREASIFRFAETLQASIFLDISDMDNVMKSNNCLDILLNRFESGGIVPRVLHPDRGAFEDTHYYQVYGPTIIATNTPLNYVLETRSIVISMQESDKHFANEVSPDKIHGLKARLLALRAFYLGEKLPQTDKLFASRLGDILRPLHTIIQTVCPEEEQKFIALAQEMKKENVTVKAMTREGTVLQTIISLQNQVQNGILSIEDIASSHNLGKPERFHTSPKSIGRIIQSLGFYGDTYRPKTSDGKAAMPWNEQVIASLARSYGLEFQPIADANVSEFSGLSDLLQGVE